jgi:RNA polymerase sigma factor (sigma-70 family)
MSPDQALPPAVHELFEHHLPALRRQLRRAGVVRLPPHEIEDFVSWGLLKVLERSREVLAGFRGDAPLLAYLGVVARRLAIDYGRSLWGKWKPSAEACRHGTTGLALDRLLNRDQLSVGEAIGHLRQHPGCCQSSGRLREIAATLPGRTDRRPLPLDDYRLPVTAPVDPIAEREREEKIRATTAAVRDCLARVTTLEDRWLLSRRFLEQRSMADLAEELEVPVKTLYRRLEGILRRVRQEVKRRGLGADDLREALAGPRQGSGLLPPLAPGPSTPAPQPGRATGNGRPVPSQVMLGAHGAPAHGKETS